MKPSGLYEKENTKTFIKFPKREISSECSVIVFLLFLLFIVFVVGLHQLAASFL